MLERFRLFVERPLEPSAGRAILALAAAILLGLALLFVLAGREADRRGASRERATTHASPRPAPAPPWSGSVAPAQREPGRRARRQDPQDEQAGAAGRRARAELRSHRALQHVPYREGGLTIRLAGARRGKALLVVGASSVSAARRDWRRFLRRYRDAGRAYVPLFEARGGRDG